MANIRTSESKAKAKKSIMVKVLPATDNSRRLGYARINRKVIPFDVPVKVSEQDLIGLRHQKEPTNKANKTINVDKIMNELQVPQEKANKIARMNESQNMNSKIEFIPKYFVQVL